MRECHVHIFYETSYENFNLANFLLNLNLKFGLNLVLTMDC